MKISDKQVNVLRWAVRIVGLVVLVFALPFYFGYGNPLPFVNPDYTVFDNVWLSAFPLILLGLALGWKWEKVGGWMIVAPIVVGTVVTIFTIREFIPGPMYFPLVVGGLYLFLGYRKKVKKRKA